MKNINWVRKLTSRKFWAAIVGFITPTMMAFGVSDNQATQVAAIIMAGGTLIAYIIGEGIADAGNSVSHQELEEGLYNTSAIGFGIENINDDEE